MILQDESGYQCYRTNRLRMAAESYGTLACRLRWISVLPAITTGLFGPLLGGTPYLGTQTSYGRPIW